MLEAKRREEQKAAATQKQTEPLTQPEKPVKPEGKAKKSRIAEALAALPAQSVAPAVQTPSGFPPDAAQKLNELYASASLYRQKMATLQAKPAGQQFGLEMTQKLLKNVEDEIAALEKKYAQS
jgi:hypothetical protein